MDNDYRLKIMNEMLPFKKADPEVEKRTKDRERLAQFYIDSIVCDLLVSEIRALAEARGLSLDDAVMAATIKRLFNLNRRQIKDLCQTNKQSSSLPAGTSQRV